MLREGIVFIGVCLSTGGLRYPLLEADTPGADNPTLEGTWDQRHPAETSKISDICDFLKVSDKKMNGSQWKIYILNHFS